MKFAHQRDMALTMAQRRMVEQMASVQKTKKTTKKKKKSSLGWFQKHVSRTSSSLNANQTKIIKNACPDWNHWIGSFILD